MAWGDKYINKNVDVKALVWLSFKAARTKGSAAKAADTDYEYVIANEMVNAFTINPDTGTVFPSKFTLSRKSSIKPKRRYFSDTHGTYTLRSNHAADLNLMFLAKDANQLKAKITLEVSHGMFSEYLLRYVARTGSDGGEFHNLANPAGGDEMTDLDNDLVKLKHSTDFGKKHWSKTTYKFAKKADRKIGPISCVLTGRDVNNSGKKPQVKLFFRIEVDKLPAADRDRVTRMLLAADHYMLIKKAPKTSEAEAKFLNDAIKLKPTQAPAGKKQRFDVTADLFKPKSGGGFKKTGTHTQFIEENEKASALHRSLLLWRKNITTYFVNYVPVTRGIKIHDKLVAEAVKLAGDPKTTRDDLVLKIRDEIDKYLITANHWHGSRELYKKAKVNPAIEKHQHILSDTFGEIHGSSFFGGSPVFYQRNVPLVRLHWIDKGAGEKWFGSKIYWHNIRKSSWNDKEEQGFVFQIGTGHCGEHAAACFSVIKEAMQKEPKVIALLTNIIRSGNVNIDHAFCVVGMHADPIFDDVRSKAWGKRKVGEKLSVWDLEMKILEGQDGVIMDAYLGDVQRKTPAGLLKKIKRKEGQPYLKFKNQFPLTGSVDADGLDDL